MDEVILDRINTRVGKHDTLFHLGDFTNMETEEAVQYRRRIRCKNVYLVLGNHDKHTRKCKKFCQKFVKTRDILEIERNGRLIVMCHYPIRVWHHWDKGAWHLHGHLHGCIPDQKEFHMSLDVGVDDHDFKPWSFEEIEAYMAPKVAAFDGMEVNENTW